MSYEFAFRRYRLPFRAPMRTAHGPWAEREGVIVRLVDADGVAGYGEAAPIPWFGTETVDEVEAVCRELGPRVDENRLAAVPEPVGCLKNALSAARERGGGAESKHPHLGVAALLPAGRAVLEAIPPKVEMGFRVFKWKVGVGDVADELALLDDVCGALPDGAKLRLDANGAWDRRRAERWLERTAERPVEFVEQPCHAGAEADARARGKADDVLLGLAGDFPTKLALDESITREADLETWLGRGWPGIFVVKPSLLASPVSALARLRAAKADVVFSSALETAVGARAALRLAFTWDVAPRALGFGVWPLFRDPRFDGPIAAPFVWARDVESISSAGVWNALS